MDGNLKRSQQATNADRKRQKRESVSIANCRRFGDNMQSKTLFQLVFDPRSSPELALYDCRLFDMIMLRFNTALYLSVLVYHLHKNTCSDIFVAHNRRTDKMWSVYMIIDFAYFFKKP